MPPLLNSLPNKHRILIVDDEPDIHTLTKLSLKGLQYRGCPIEFLTASTGEDAVRLMSINPEIAVILLDVVMETNTAGLDACRAIREELGNRFVRILLRTGQPGVAPERQTINQFDIDGYLPKAELTADRLHAAVRTAIKAWEELIELDRHRSYLAAIHDCAVSIRSFDLLEKTLDRVLDTAVAICPTDLALLTLETFDHLGNPRNYFLHLSENPDPVRAEAEAASLAARVSGHSELIHTSGQVEGGFVEPLVLHRELGHGWIYLRGVTPDALTSKVLPMLAAHAANALYSVVAQGMLAAREGPIYDTMIV
jgi:CheY-like chemotaxis protein